MYAFPCSATVTSRGGVDNLLNRKIKLGDWEGDGTSQITNKVSHKCKTAWFLQHTTRRMRVPRYGPMRSTWSAGVSARSVKSEYRPGASILPWGGGRA